MEFLKYFSIAIIVVFSFAFLILAARSKKALKYILLNALLGIFVFLILYFTKNYSGIALPLNPITASVSAVFGIPGVIGLLFLNFIV